MAAGESSLADRTGTKVVVTAGIVAACRRVAVVSAGTAIPLTDPRAAVSVDCGTVPYRVSVGDARPRVPDAAQGGRTSVAGSEGRITVSVEF
jgi:hypothetical protein